MLANFFLIQNAFKPKLELDTWLTRIEADTGDISLEEKVRRNKPATAVDACWIAGVKITDMQKCRATFPYYADPLISAPHHEAGRTPAQQVAGGQCRDQSLPLPAFKAS